MLHRCFFLSAVRGFRAIPLITLIALQRIKPRRTHRLRQTETFHHGDRALSANVKELSPSHAVIPNEILRHVKK